MQMRSGKRILEHSESGAVFIEAAFILPVVILLVGGLVDLGFALRRAHVLADIVRQTGRTVAAESLQDDGPAAQALCKAIRDQTLECRDPRLNPNGADPDLLSAIDCRSGQDSGTIECAAIRDVQRGLVAASMDLADWKVIALTCIDSGDERFASWRPNFLRVSIQRQRGRGCFLCFFLNWLGDDPASNRMDSVRSAFALEGQC